MKQNVSLTIVSLLSVLLFSLHLADDIVRGFEAGGPSNLLAIPIFVTWLYGTLVLSGRRSGYLLLLALSLLGAFVPVLHFRGAGGVAGRGIAESSGAFFWVWTLVALGVTSLFSAILSAEGFWNLRKHGSRESAPAPAAAHRTASARRRSRAPPQYDHAAASRRRPA